MPESGRRPGDRGYPAPHCNRRRATHFHAFPSAGGVTGMVLLAESHISIHTWPEHGFAAVDIFMCGPAKAEAAMEVIREALGSARLVVKRERRGEAIT